MLQNKGSYFNYSLIIKLGAYSAVAQTESNSQGKSSDLGADLPKGNKTILYLTSLPFWGTGDHFYSIQKSFRLPN